MLHNFLFKVPLHVSQSGLTLYFTSQSGLTLYFTRCPLVDYYNAVFDDTDNLIAPGDRINYTCKDNLVSVP